MRVNCHAFYMCIWAQKTVVQIPVFRADFSARLSARTEPISRGHCQKSHDEAESLMMNMSIIGW